MLINHAAEQGAVVHQGVWSSRCCLKAIKRSALKCRCRTARVRSFAKVVVDATGQTAALEQVSLARARSETEESCALFLFKDAHREPDLNGGATLVLRTEPVAVVGSGISRSKTTSPVSASLRIPIIF